MASPPLCTMEDLVSGDLTIDDLFDMHEALDAREYVADQDAKRRELESKRR